MQYYFSAKSNTLDYNDNKRYDKILSKLESLGHENTNYVHMDLNSKKYKMIQNYINKNEKTVLDLLDLMEKFPNCSLQKPGQTTE